MPVSTDTTMENPQIKMKRRIIYDKEEYILLAGIPYSEMTVLPPGDIVFDPQIKIQPADSTGVENSILWKSGIYNTTYADRNWGVADYIRVMRSATLNEWHRQRILITFDVSEVPVSTIIDSAYLSLYCNEVKFLGTQVSDSVTVHKVLTEWQEGDENGAPGESCWNKRLPGISWGEAGMQAGTDYDPTICDIQTFTADSKFNWLSWDVSTLVTGWVTNEETNNGMMLKIFNDTDNDKYTQFMFHSSEDDSSATLGPKLTIYHQEADLATTYYIRDAAGNVIATYRK